MWDVRCGIKIFLYYIRNPQSEIRNSQSHISPDPLHFQPSCFPRGSPQFKSGLTITKLPRSNNQAHQIKHSLQMAEIPPRVIQIKS